MHAVRREHADAIHFVHCAEPLACGATVELRVDWPVRLDHMQQHSGQHLISAVLEQQCGWATGSWYLGAGTSFVQLDAQRLDEERLRAAERRINEIIAGGCAVSVQNVDPQALVSDAGNGEDGEDDQRRAVRATRDLPADHVGPVRVVTFAGIESNRCCGTHVRDLHQLQAVQLLHWEPARGGVQLHFLVGGRVLRYAAEAWARERRMNVALGGEAGQHVELVRGAQEKLRAAQRLVKRLQRELAAEEAGRLDAAVGVKFAFVHRKDGAAEGAAYLQVGFRC